VESDIVGKVESEVEKVLPRDLPSDTREVTALAEEAAKGVVELDPEFAPVLEEIENAFKGIDTAFDFLKGKVEKFVDVAKAKTTPPAPVPAPAPAEPVDPTPVATEPAPSSPPVSTPPAETPADPSPAPDPDAPISPLTPSDPVTPTTDSTSTDDPPTPDSDPTPSAATDPDEPTASALATFKSLTPAEQAAFLQSLAAGESA
jgi:hypothetical protein